MNLIHKLFYLNFWAIGYRKISNADDILPCGENIISYQIIPVPKNLSCADPFVFEYEGKIFLFAETLNPYRGKGVISVAEYENGKFSNFHEVLRESFHLSYPNVFAYKNDIFMIPETNEARQVRLYKAVDFPNKWELDSILIDNGKTYVDTSVLIEGDEVKIFSYITEGGGGLQKNTCWILKNVLLLLFRQAICIQTGRPEMCCVFLGIFSARCKIVLIITDKVCIYINTMKQKTKSITAKLLLRI